MTSMAFTSALSLLLMGGILLFSTPTFAATGEVEELFKKWTESTDMESKKGYAEKIAQAAPTSPYGRVIRGWRLILEEKYPEAVIEFQAALSMNPDLAEAHSHLGIIYALQQEFEKAITAYETALRIKPKDGSIRNNLGLAYFHMGNIRRAIAEFRLALLANPALPDAHNNLGLAYAEEGDFDKAIEEYIQAIKFFNAYVDAHVNLGAALYQVGRMDDAIAEFEMALQLDPKSGKAHLNLGTVFGLQKKFSEAAQELEKALSLIPHDPLIHFQLAFYLEKTDRLREALVHYETFLDKDKGRHPREGNFSRERVADLQKRVKKSIYRGLRRPLPRQSRREPPPLARFRSLGRSPRAARAREL